MNYIPFDVSTFAVGLCAQQTLAILDKLDIETEKPTQEEIARKFGYEEDYAAGRLSLWQRFKPATWSLFDEPYSSLAAKVSGTRPPTGSTRWPVFYSKQSEQMGSGPEIRCGPNHQRPLGCLLSDLLIDLLGATGSQRCNPLDGDPANGVQSTAADARAN